MFPFSRKIAALVGLCVLAAGVAPVSVQAEIDARFVLGAAGFESYCLAPVLNGEKPSPNLKSAGDGEWWLSNGVVLKAIESSKGHIGCQVYPSVDQRVDLETLAALSENFDVWVKTQTSAKMLREYQACEAFGEGTRRVLDTSPKLNGETVRVVFETRPELSLFIILAAQTNVLTPPADCAPWET